MKSHDYEFTRNDLTRLIGLPLLFVCSIAVALQCAKILHFLPRPLPILDVDRTILLHQAQAAINGSSAEIVLIGDSSCLMDAQADPLQTQLGKPVLNLGTLSYLDLDSYSGLLRQYASTHKQLKTVVLLMHLEALRIPQANNYYTDTVARFYNSQDFCDPRSSRIICNLGANLIHGRIFPRLLPVALPGIYGKAYGFNWNLWDHLSRYNGSAFDPRTFDATSSRGNPEYRLALSLDKKSQLFRKALPVGTRLVVGITPSPRSFVLEGHDQRCHAMLLQWKKWLNADAALESLPCSLDDALFASTTHLNQRGATEFTTQLAAALTLTDIPSQNGR